MLYAWAIKWGVPFAALEDLRAQMGTGLALAVPLGEGGKSEAGVTSEVRRRAAHQGRLLWRNNLGAYQDETGRWVRYGLVNDSKQMNAHLKSSDWIGCTPVTVTAGMVGTTVGVFTGFEIKHAGWSYSGTPREVAQNRFNELVVANGGIARFVSDQSQI